MTRTLALLLGLFLLSPPTFAQPSTDARLGKLKTLNDYFPMRVPKNKAEWDVRRTELREQVLVANGLWPMPPKTPLEPVIHGKVEREGYTVEKVYFASLPGHYVTGNLYRPTGKNGKRPGVLCPHGHWANGRFYDAGDGGAQAQIKEGAEKTVESGRYPLQARCVQLARMGCVVFFYDMIGYADSKKIGHRTGFTDADAELRLQSFMGLQTWNSIRALDFLMSLSEVDGKRIGVTGASGGGTQTFILGAIDDRPTVAFPAVMVSTAMQGGCICENCSFLRTGAGNIDLAALFAPRPLAMSGANDWTIDIEKKGLPELKALYKMLGVEDKVMAKCYPQFGHNYNQVSRELMYEWFNKHLELGHKSPISEQPFVPIPPKELSVFDAEHPEPKNSADAKTLRQYLSSTSDKQIAALTPGDEKSLKEYRKVIGTALRTMIGDRLPELSDVEMTPVGEKGARDGVTRRLFTLSRKDSKEVILALGLRGDNFDGTVVVWVHPKGRASLYADGKLVPEVRKLLDSKAGILAPDVFWTGDLIGVVVQVKTDAKKLQQHKLTKRQAEQLIEKAVPKVLSRSKALGDIAFLFPKGENGAARAVANVGLDEGPLKVSDLADVAVAERIPINEGFAGYSYGYNRSLLAERVHDILTAVASARGHEKTKKVHLVGFGEAGPWVMLVRALCGDAVARTAADVNGFRFDSVRTTDDAMMLPGAIKYGGLAMLTGLAAPGELLLHGNRSTGLGKDLKSVYSAAKADDRLTMEGGMLSVAKVIDWLVRK